ncbi:nucleoporin Nup120/160-domain-containing protein [Xylariaceae sp. FL1019]|nr:nucleoporin Nup120/160-domain-containing protein [Xylariaceae sp. FL1019]
MATREPSYAFKEARLSLEPTSPTAVVDIQLPDPSNTAPRRQIKASAGASDQTVAFRARNCATASAVYHRKHHHFPGSFLWRVLDDSHVLSIRAIDVCKPDKASDATLVLNFYFPNQIRPSCVALADPQDHDALAVYVVDQVGQLYTLFLRPDSFRKRSFVENGLGDVCKVHMPAALKGGFKTPFRLIAVNSNQLVIALTDGGNLRLDKNASHTVSQPTWKEVHYNARSLLRGFQKYIMGKPGFDETAAAAAVETGLGMNNASYLLTVCLDHRLRIWNLNTGQILGAMDLLNAPRDPQEMGKWHLDSTQTNLIRIIGETEGKRLCITYSPIGAGEFKFWKMESDDDLTVDVNDLYPNARLIPSPPLGSDVWTLADFNVTERVGGHGLRMWIMWKNNMAYRIQELSFLVDELPEVWSDQWRSVYSDTMIPSPPVSSPSDPVQASERWLKLILTPDRFSHATLKAALSAYEQAIGMTEKKGRASQDVAESICSAISSSASLQKASSGALDYEGFRTSTESHWRKFYRILVEIDKPRGEALSLAYEPRTEMPWVVCADSISAIRDFTALERIYYNPQSRHMEPDDLSSFIATAHNFVEVFSDSTLQICKSVLHAELFEESSKTDQERIQFFSDKAGFWRQISDEDCSQVTDVLGANFNVVTSNLYQQMMALCNATWNPKRPMEYPLTEFGRGVIIRAAKDVAELQWNVCFSQLILLVHMEFEFDRPEDALHNRINIGIVYRSLLQALRRLELIRWLANTRLPASVYRGDKSNSMSGSPSNRTKRPGDDVKLSTVLEESIGHLLGVSDIGFEPASTLPSAITNIVGNLCAHESDVELQPQYIQCALLVRERADLALELSPFADQDPFSVYIQGRVSLALRNFEDAALFFKKAAYGMSTPQANPGRHSSGLLDDEEWNLLFNGAPRYYAHILSLYEKQKAYSFVVDFAQLALQFINKKTPDADLIRTEVQSRLFSAAAALSRFELAHSTLVAMKDRALQHSFLRTLIQKMCDNLHNTELVALSFPGLQNAVDEILEQKCEETVDVITGVPYHQILYSWRIKRNDYRGAAAILLDRIQKLRQLGEGDQLTGEDMLDTVITRQYLMLINVLSCVEVKQAWVTTEDVLPQSHGKGVALRGKRKVVTLADIRKEYQDELDRIAAIQNNQFGFAADDEMDIL